MKNELRTLNIEHPTPNAPAPSAFSVQRSMFGVLFLLPSLLLSLPAQAQAPANQTLNLQIWGTSGTPGYRPTLFPVAGQNGKVLGVVDGAWALTTGGSSGAWGDITGTLADQTDLNTALGLKAALAGATFTGPILFSGSTNAGLKFSNLTTAQRNALTAASGMGIWNTTTNQFEVYNGSGWGPPAAAGSVAWGAITGTLTDQTDLNTALGLKATLASPTFTGTPVAPTAAAGTNTTQLATTGFVQQQFAANAGVAIRHDTGLITWHKPSADTDVARGTALSAAVAAAVDGETVFVTSGVYDLGTGRLQLANNVDLAMDTGAHITSTAILTSGVIVRPGNNSIISGGTIEGTGDGTNIQVPIGIETARGDSAVTGVQIIGCTLIADGDGVYFSHAGAYSCIVRDCTILTKFDAIAAFSDIGGSASTVDVYNSRIIVTGPSSAGNNTSRGIFSSYNATVRVFGGSISVTNGGTTINAGAYTATGTIKLYDVAITTSNGANPNADVWQTGGTLQVTGGKGSSTNGRYSTTGTITYQGADLVAANNFSDIVTASTARTNLGLAIGTNVQAYDADLTTYAGITPSANIQSLLGSADYSAARTNLGLVIGTNVQAYDADLTTYAGITPSANIQTFLGSANNAAALTNLGAVGLSGTNVFTGQNTFNLSPRIPRTNLSAGTALTINTNYYDTLTAIRTLTFTGTPAEGDEMSLQLTVTGGPHVLTVPTSYRVGASSSTTTISLPTGNHLIRWNYTNARWVMTDSGVDAEAAYTFYANPTSAAAAPSFVATDTPNDGEVLSWQTGGTLEWIASGGGGTWDTIGDPAGDGTIAFGATQQLITSTIDTAANIALELSNTDADAANANTLLKLSHNDGADAEVTYLSMVGDKDGTPTIDFSFNQSTGFTSLLPIVPPAEAYDATGWNSDTGAPQKDAVRDKLEAMQGLVITTEYPSGITWTDNLDVYYGFTDSALAISAANYNLAKIEVPKTGTIKRVWFKLSYSVAGSGETVNAYVRVNDTNDYPAAGIPLTTNGASPVHFVDSTISQAVTAGDYICIKIDSPADYVTPPTSVRLLAMIYIE
jgi:hypothetical protein